MSGARRDLLVVWCRPMARPVTGGGGARVGSMTSPVSGSSGMIWPRSRPRDARLTLISASARAARSAFARDGMPGPTVLMSSEVHRTQTGGLR